MNCPRSCDLHTYFDDELDVPLRAAFAEHLPGCPECSSELQIQKAIRTGLQDGVLPLPRLRHGLQTAYRRHSVRPPRRGGRCDPGWQLRRLSLRHRPRRGRDVPSDDWKVATGANLPRDLVVAHVRSLQAEHLEDVKSSDKHTVKPWFTGQVDFSPPVKDFTEQGYPLLGGRLDYLDQRPTAALVYGRAKHIINLFIWPAGGDGDSSAQTLVRRGYNLSHWTREGLEFWAVSDLNAEELGEFARLNRESP